MQTFVIYLSAFTRRVRVCGKKTKRMLFVVSYLCVCWWNRNYKRNARSTHAHFFSSLCVTHFLVQKLFPFKRMCERHRFFYFSFKQLLAFLFNQYLYKYKIINADAYRAMP